MPATKEARLNIRISLSDSAVIRDAAESLGQTVTDYVVTTAVERSLAVLADRRHFVLDEANWELFVTGFEREPRFVEPIAELFARPSRIDV
jgi:uncharacterized protein (DUF1778 family)